MEENHFLTKVYKCSVCDSIIPTDKCAESHGQDCRPPNNYKTKSWKYKQMTEISFPCPRTILHKLPSNLSAKSLEKFLARGTPKYNPTSSLGKLPNRSEKFTEEEIRERCRYLNDIRAPLPRWYPRDRGIEKPQLLHGSVRIPTQEEIEARRKKIENKKAQGNPNYVGDLDSSDGDSSDSEAETKEIDKPYICPLRICGINLKDKLQLKSHFIMHLENNPWACPFPGCNVKLNSQPHFKRHIHWHMFRDRKLACCRRCGQTYSNKREMKEHACFPQQPQPDMSKRSENRFKNAYEFLKAHYDNLKAEGLLVGESDERDIYFDFGYQINMDAIIETDPVFIKTCKKNPNLWNLLFQTATETGIRNPYGNPYTCPLERCAIKLHSKSHLKSHFIMHLENNPWACSVPGCNVKLDSHPHFRRHQQWHFGYPHDCCKKCGYTCSSTDEMKRHTCFPQFPAPDLSKRPNKSLDHLKSHYENLKAKGLLLGNQRMLIDSDYKIDMDRVIKIDPVFLRVCKERPEFRNEIFADEDVHPSQSDTSRTMMEAQEANDYNLAKTLEGMERNLSSAQIQSFGWSEEQFFDVISTPYHYDNDLEDLGKIKAYTQNQPFACPLKKCKAGSPSGSIIESRSQFKTHFIIHLQNNPFKCPIPDCNAKFNSQGEFRHHLEWHMGKHRISPCEKCGQIFSTEAKQKSHICVRENPRSPDQDRENEEKLKKEYDAAKCCVRGHYADLKAKGLLLEESPGHLLEFDFKFKIDIDRIIETDPVYLKVCQARTGFYHQIFGDAQDQDPQPSTSRAVAAGGVNSWVGRGVPRNVLLPYPAMLNVRFEGRKFPTLPTRSRRPCSRGMGGSSVQNIITTMDFSNITPNINNDNVLERHPDSEIEDIGEIRNNYPPDNPFACPLKACEVKLTNRSQLKSHFIIHLKNNPYACLIPGCRVRLDSQCKFNHHMQRHLGQDQEKADQAKFCIRKHYADLQSRGLLLEESEEHALKFDFKYKVDIDTIIKTDEVLLKVCMLDETFYDRLFGDDHPQPRTSTSTGGGSQLEANLRMENGDNCNEGDASSIVETPKMVKNSVERETAPDEFIPHLEKHESGLTGESSPPEMNETVETESFTAEQTNFHDHDHDASKSDIYLKRLENGQFECTECKLSCKSEAGGKRHWLLKHNVKISNIKELPSKVGDGSGPSKMMLSNGEKPHCSQSSRKRKSPNDVNRDTNVKAVKVEPELDLGLTLIVPKKEEADCDCDVDLDIKPEIPTDQIKKEESEDFITGDVPPSNNVQLKTEPM